MATLDLSILRAALDDRLFAAPLTQQSQLYVHQSIVTAHAILNAASVPDGVSSQQLSKRLELHQNTVKQYCRWLISVKLLEEAIEKSGKYNVKIYRKSQ